MRPLEITYLLLNVPLLGWCLLNMPIPGWGRFVPAITLMFMTADILIDGARWTMAPAFAVTLWLFLTCTWPRFAQPSRWTGLAMIGLMVGTVSMAVLLPVFELPKPTGSYLVGTVTRHLIDSGRLETRGNSAGGPRELMIQIWYPTQQHGPRQAYRKHSEVSLVKQHLAFVQTHAGVGVPLPPGRERFPLILFAPSWTGRRSQNTVQAEELATHGFVVVGIDHPYSSDLTIFPDGRKARTTLGEFLDCQSDEAFAAGFRAANEELHTRTDDARFVLDQVERFDRDDPERLLAGRIDFSRVGIFGHSFGGAVAAELCRTDVRCKAGIDYDGLLFGDVVEEGVGKPFLFLMDGTPVPTRAELDHYTGRARRELDFVVNNVGKIRTAPSNAKGFWASIRGTRHMDFCDSPLYTPVKQLSHAGPIDSRRSMEIINAYTVAFFDAYLNGKNSDLFAAQTPEYPEVKVENLLVGKAATSSASAKAVANEYR